MKGAAVARILFFLSQCEALPQGKPKPLSRFSPLSNPKSAIQNPKYKDLQRFQKIF